MDHTPPADIPRRGIQMANEVITPADVATVNGTAAVDRMEDYRAYMLRRAQDDGNDSKGLAQAISARNMTAIFYAETEDAIWAAGTGGAVQGRDAVGLELEIHGFRPVVSTRVFDGEDEVTRKGYYVSCDAVVIGGPADVLRKLDVNIGDEIAFQTGADDVEYRLRAFEVRGFLNPAENKFIKARVKGIETASGNTLLKLEPIPVRAMPGNAGK
jgi:hypothetical protein